ncbi:MAG: hypothetical protein ACREUU_15330, partial [Gammaproteobacteria bacterium]
TELVQLAGTEGADRPFFSADGQWIAFTANRKLKKVSVQGGAPIAVCDSEWGGGAWDSDDTIVYTPAYNSGLWRVPASGGTPEKLTEPDRSKRELGHWWPQLLPDGETILFTRFSTPIQRSRIGLYSLKTRQEQTLIEGGMFARYLPTGHIVFARSNTLMAVPFDARRLRVGRESAVVDDVAIELSNGLAQASFSANGTLAYIKASTVRGYQRLVWVDRKGNARPILDEVRDFAYPRLSPDGRRLAVSIREKGENWDIWVLDLERGSLTRATYGASADFEPVWTHDGKRLIFVSEQPVYDLYSKAVDGSGGEEPLLAGSVDKHPSSISPDGKLLAYWQNEAEGGSDLWLLPLAGDRKPSLLLRTPFAETQPAFSPDGRWLAYCSNESGRDQIYIQPFPVPGQRFQISIESGRSPVWSRNGNELFFHSGRKVMTVPIKTKPPFVAGTPVVLFEGDFRESSAAADFDVAPDGQRFLMMQRDAQAPRPEIHVVLSWFEELKRRVK